MPPADIGPRKLATDRNRNIPSSVCIAASAYGIVCIYHCTASVCDVIRALFSTGNAPHCKTIHRYFVASFPYLVEPVPGVPYTSVSVNRRNNEAAGPHCIVGPDFAIPPIYVDTRIRNRFRENTENSPLNIRGHTDIFTAPSCELQSRRIACSKYAICCVVHLASSVPTTQVIYPHRDRQPSGSSEWQTEPRR